GFFPGPARLLLLGGGWRPAANVGHGCRTCAVSGGSCQACGRPHLRPAVKPSEAVWPYFLAGAAAASPALSAALPAAWAASPADSAASPAAAPASSAASSALAPAWPVVLATQSTAGLIQPSMRAPPAAKDLS